MTGREKKNETAGRRFSRSVGGFFEKVPQDLQQEYEQYVPFFKNTPGLRHTQWEQHMYQVLKAQRSQWSYYDNKKRIEHERDLVLEVQSLMMTCVVAVVLSGLMTFLMNEGIQEFASVGKLLGQIGANLNAAMPQVEIAVRMTAVLGIVLLLVLVGYVLPAVAVAGILLFLLRCIARENAMKRAFYTDLVVVLDRLIEEERQMPRLTEGESPGGETQEKAETAFGKGGTTE